jgi:hypothetical protein
MHELNGDDTSPFSFLMPACRKRFDGNIFTGSAGVPTVIWSWDLIRLQRSEASFERDQPVTEE